MENQLRMVQIRKQENLTGVYKGNQKKIYMKKPKVNKIIIWKADK